MMNLTPLIANFSWDDVLYFLIPLIWVLQYFLPNKEKKEQNDDTPAGRAAQEEAQERMRRVREEIRRRAEAQRESRPVMEEAPVAPVSPTVKQLRPARPQSQPAPLARPERVPQAGMGEAEREFAAPSRAEQLQNRLEEQRARLAESKRVKEDVLRNAKKRRSAIMAGRPEPRFDFTGGDLRSEVFATLKSPRTARKAIVLSEILGEPRAIKPYR